LFGTIRRAARRAVRKYDLVEVVIALENCSTSSSTRGTPRMIESGIPTALNEISTRPRRVDHGLEMLVHGPLVESVDLRRLSIRRRKRCPWRRLGPVPRGAR
jgi:hypothetical protein